MSATTSAPPTAPVGVAQPKDLTAVTGRRILAAIVDTVVYIAVIAATLAATAEYVPIPEGFAEDSPFETACDAVEAQGEEFAGCAEIGDRAYLLEDADVLLVWLASIGWFVVVYVLLQGLLGTTIGKSIAGVRVVSTSGGRPGMGRSLVRTVAWAIDAQPAGLPAVGLITAVTTNGHRRVGDMIAKTYVVGYRDTGIPIGPNGRPAFPTRGPAAATATATGAGVGPGWTADAPAAPPVSEPTDDWANTPPPAQDPPQPDLAGAASAGVGESEVDPESSDSDGAFALDGEHDDGDWASAPPEWDDAADDAEDGFDAEFDDSGADDPEDGAEVIDEFDDDRAAEADGDHDDRFDDEAVDEAVDGYQPEDWGQEHATQPELAGATSAPQPDLAGAASATPMDSDGAAATDAEVESTPWADEADDFPWEHEDLDDPVDDDATPAVEDGAELADDPGAPDTDTTTTFDRLTGDEVVGDDDDPGVDDAAFDDGGVDPDATTTFGREPDHPEDDATPVDPVEEAATDDPWAADESEDDGSTADETVDSEQGEGDDPAHPDPEGDDLDAEDEVSDASLAPETPPAATAAAHATPARQAPRNPPPQWDAARNTYIQWDARSRRWLQWDTAAERWKPIEA